MIREAKGKRKWVEYAIRSFKGRYLKHDLSLAHKRVALLDRSKMHRVQYRIVFER